MEKISRDLRVSEFTMSSLAHRSLLNFFTHKMTQKITSTEIKKMLKSANFIIGTKRTIKNLKLGRVQKVLVSSNCPAKVENNLNYYAQLSGAEYHKLDFPNEELGIICKKPFSISVLAVIKGVSK